MRAFVRRGLLQVRSFAAPPAITARTSKRAAGAAALAAAVAGGGTNDMGAANAGGRESVKLPVDGALLGIAMRLYVEAPPTDDLGTTITPLTPATSRESVVPDRYSAVHAFIEGLVSRGRVAAERKMAAHALLIEGPRAGRVTHHLVKVGDGVELRRLIFECGY
jgi:hypothetical protein